MRALISLIAVSVLLGGGADQLVEERLGRERLRADDADAGPLAPFVVNSVAVWK